MNILVIGAGGREHTLAWKIAQSPQNPKVFVAPGNAGTAEFATNIPLSVSNFEAIGQACIVQEIDLVVIGPEAPLVGGLTYYLRQHKALREHIRVIGPESEGAMLEGSKDFAKQFMGKYGIPTAKAQTFTADQLKEGKAFLGGMKPPYVLKADGLAAGKGVIITKDLAEAQATLEEMLNGKFGKASAQVLVEEFLDGVELSVFALTDGKDYVLLPSAKDYKRIGEGDTGLNTGGMGAVTPVPFADAGFMQKVEERIVKPTIKGIHEEGFDYKGFVFFGLINVGGDPYVIEYNVRMGDPETEVVLPALETDLLDLLIKAADQQLSGATVSFKEGTTTTVMLVSGGYPEKYQKGKLITGLDQIGDEVTAFHAGTGFNAEGDVLTNGGRVIALTASGSTMEEALAKSYAAAEKVDFVGKYYRKDIGFDLK